MLGTRIVTAIVVLIPFLLSLMAASPLPFQALTLAFIAAAGWEWARLNQAGPAAAIAFALVVVAACVAALLAGWTADAPAAAWWAAAALWFVGGVLAILGGPVVWPAVPRGLRWLIGPALLWAAWLAMVRSQAIGINYMLSVFCLVWMADIAAYAGGRAFGRRKLAPAISPGKSWEGVWTGMAGVLLLALLWAGWIDRSFAVDSPSLYTQLARSLGLAGAALALVALAGVSVVGDLVESLVKRAAGAKDSSGLLPGHGGVLDRIDALLPTFPVALALVLLRGQP